MLPVQEALHLILVDEEDGAVGRRCCAPHADGLTGEASFAKELAGAQHRHDGLPARLRDHRELHATFLDVQDVLTRRALGKDDFGSPILHNLSGNPRRLEKRLGIECAFWFRFHGDVPWKASARSLSRRAI